MEKILKMVEESKVYTYTSIYRATYLAQTITASSRLFTIYYFLFTTFYVHFFSFFRFFVFSFFHEHSLTPMTLVSQSCPLEQISPPLSTVPA